MDRGETRRRAQKPQTRSKKAADARKVRTPVKRRVATPQRETARAAGSPDTTLLIGGLVLVVLALANTVFLTLSVRFLRGAV